MTRSTGPCYEMRFYCPQCEFKNKTVLEQSRAVSCIRCRHTLVKEGECNLELMRQEPARCILCGNDQFYLSKDFNRGLGFLIFLVGAVASIWTYGISLAVAAVIDAILYKRLPFLKMCYVCDCEFKGFPIFHGDKSYDHVLGDQLRVTREEWHINKKQ